MKPKDDLKKHIIFLIFIIIFASFLMTISYFMTISYIVKENIRLNNMNNYLLNLTNKSVVIEDFRKHCITLKTEPIIEESCFQDCHMLTPKLCSIFGQQQEAMQYMANEEIKRLYPIVE